MATYSSFARKPTKGKELERKFANSCILQTQYHLLLSIYLLKHSLHIISTWNVALEAVYTAPILLISRHHFNTRASHNAK